MATTSNDFSHACIYFTKPAKCPLSTVRDGATLVYHSFVTLEEAVIGLVIAALLSFVTAIAIDHWQIFKNSLYPLLVVSQTLPIMVINRFWRYGSGLGCFLK